MKNYRFTEPFLRRVSAQLAVAIIAASSAWAQSTAVGPSTPTASQTDPGNSSVAVPAEDIIELSPFEVQGSNRGYQAANTMSGTRLNAKIEDLAASISVVTKQQLEDTAAIDINDIFLYEANTEGLQQYTEFTIDRNFYVENTTLNPQSANRIRGIGSANNSINNFATMGSVPIDTYNLSSVEISRGPNANIFGLGNAAGTVNIIADDADVTKNSSRVVTRADSYGGWRASANFNRVLKKEKAAVRVAVLRDEKGFERKPAYEDINRLFASVTLKPFRTTTIRAGYESYHNHFSRANTTLPRDSITEWMAGGMPVWNPTAAPSGGWRLLNGSTYTAVATSAEVTGLPTSLMPGSLNSQLWTSPAVIIEPDGRVSYYGMGAASSTLTGPTPAGTPAFRLVESGSSYRRGRSASGVPQTLFQAPSITDKSIYDWEEVNFLSPNYGRDKGDLYRIEIDQTLINSGMHFLGARVGQYREVIDRYDHAVFSRSDSGVPYIVVDVNEVLLDGSTNPNFLRPYMGGGQPTIKYTDERNTHSRAEVAYQLDLTNESGWMRWLGKHTVNFYGERRDILTTSLSGRDLNVVDYSWSSANDRGSLPLRGNTYRLYPRYYLGDAVTSGGSVVDYAPAERFNLGNVPFSWYTSGRARVNEAATIQEVIQSGNSRDREIRSKGVVWMGSFWNDRIIPTFGWREDRNRERSSRNLNANLNATSTIDPATHLHDLSWVNIFPNPWEEKQGQSRQQGIVIKPTKWLNLNYNRSSGFKPETLAYNINSELLQNPTGKTEDYGITLKLLDEKLVARVTRYETVEKNSRNGSITSAAVTRTLRLFYDPSSSNAITGTSPVPAPPYATLPNGSDAFDLEQNATQWELWAAPGITVDEARSRAMTKYLIPLGVTDADIQRVRTLGASAFTDVNTVTSTGTELELTYNPTRNWTMKLTGAQQKAVDTELGNAVNDYINSRLAAVQSIIIPTNAGTDAATGNNTAGRPWWITGQSATSTNSPAAFYIANVKSVIGLATANAGKRRAQTREYRANFTTNYRLSDLFGDTWLRNGSVGGAVRWSSKAALGYYGGAPAAEYGGAVIDYDANRPIYDDPRAEFDLMVSYNLKLWNEKVRCKLQLNVKNLTESGRLQAIAYNPDGVAWNYRIVDPRQFILTATFDF
jgi:outer membrane receptor protein involved in Fe transport